ncbi:MAG: hypothetical protein LBB26_00290, partial [Puniceicoccales bacterium]|nr:hypothetical protein [Puniceicoccales bacterium]
NAINITQAEIVRKELAAQMVVIKQAVATVEELKRVYDETRAIADKCICLEEQIKGLTGEDCGLSNTLAPVDSAKHLLESGCQKTSDIAQCLGALTEAQFQEELQGLVPTLEARVAALKEQLRVSSSGAPDERKEEFSAQAGGDDIDLCDGLSEGYRDSELEDENNASGDEDELLRSNYADGGDGNVLSGVSSCDDDTEADLGLQEVVNVGEAACRSVIAFLDSIEGADVGSWDAIGGLRVVLMQSSDGAPEDRIDTISGALGGVASVWCNIIGSDELAFGTRIRGVTDTAGGIVGLDLQTKEAVKALEVTPKLLPPPNDGTSGVLRKYFEDVRDTFVEYLEFVRTVCAVDELRTELMTTPGFLGSFQGSPLDEEDSDSLLGINSDDEDSESPKEGKDSSFLGFEDGDPLMASTGLLMELDDGDPVSPEKQDIVR